MMPLVRKRDVAGTLMLIAVFIAIGVLRLPLQVVLLITVPLSLFITWYLHRREAA
jgi:chromate transporter